MLPALVLALLIGCNANDCAGFGASADGSVSLLLSADSALNPTSKSLAEIPSINDFDISIFPGTTDDSTPVFSAKYNELPLAITLAQGTYTITATHGPLDDFNTTTPSYKASQTIQITTGQATQASLTATVHNAIIEVQYSDQFRQQYTDYHIEIITQNQTYTLANGADQLAYTAPQYINLLLCATDQNNQKITQIIDQKITQNKTHYIYSIETPENQKIIALNI